MPVDDFPSLPERVKTAIYEQAKTACPHCGLSGVAQSWAVAAYNAALVPFEENTSDVTVILRVTFPNRTYVGDLSPREHALGVAAAISDLYQAKVELIND